MPPSPTPRQRLTNADASSAAAPTHFLKAWCCSYFCAVCFSYCGSLYADASSDAATTFFFKVCAYSAPTLAAPTAVPTAAPTASSNCGRLPPFLAFPPGLQRRPDLFGSPRAAWYRRSDGIPALLHSFVCWLSTQPTLFYPLLRFLAPTPAAPTAVPTAAPTAASYCEKKSEKVYQ